jgi:hypothetical protein
MVTLHDINIQIIELRNCLGQENTLFSLNY